MEEFSFSPKQLEFLEDVRNHRLKFQNILEGSVRSGKTYVSLFAWLQLVGISPKGMDFLMVGKTVTSLKRNCLNCLSYMADGLFDYSITRKEASFLDHKIYLEGVNDVRAENKIRGMTLMGAYCDEVTLFTEEFYNMLLTRLTSKGAFLLATTNPDSPSHWLKKEFIDKREEKSVSVYHFALEDNTALSEQTVNTLKSQFTGVFYDRFILGKWVSAEGLIYSYFANNKNKFIVEHIDIFDISSVTFGLDYGASKSKTAIICIGIGRNYNCMYVLDELVISGVNSPEEMYEKFYEFYVKIVNKYNYVGSVCADWGGLGQVITKGLQRFFIRKNINIRIEDCYKYKIKNRISFTCSMFATHRIKIHQRCENFIESLESAIWDPNKEDTRLDDGTFNVDVLDAFEYAFARYLSTFEQIMTEELKPSPKKHMLVI